MAIVGKNSRRLLWPTHPQKWMPIRFQNAPVRWACRRKSLARIRPTGPSCNRWMGSSGEAPWPQPELRGFVVKQPYQ